MLGMQAIVWALTYTVDHVIKSQRWCARKDGWSWIRVRFVEGDEGIDSKVGV